MRRSFACQLLFCEVLEEPHEHGRGLCLCLWGNSVEPPTLARATDSHTIGHLFHIDVVGQVRLLAYVTAHGSGISVVSSFLACTPAVSAGWCPVRSFYPH